MTPETQTADAPAAEAPAAEERRQTEFVVVTGLSGAGKSHALQCFEDAGYFCVDNLPPALIPRFAEMLSQPGSRLRRIALVTDIRGGEFFDDLGDALQQLRLSGFRALVLFLDATDEALVARFKATRRRHPIKAGGLLESIQQERARLAAIKAQADKVLDTSHLTVQELREEITRLFTRRSDAETMVVNLVTFGYKYGLPMDADLVFDVRFLKNPHYVDDLRPLTGEQKVVREYVLSDPNAGAFLEKVKDLLRFTLPLHRREGKSYVTIAVGCTGGRHRSLTIAGELQKFLADSGYPVVVDHRDAEREGAAQG